MKRSTLLMAIGLLLAACASTLVVPSSEESPSSPQSRQTVSSGTEDVRTELKPLPSTGAIDPGRYVIENPHADNVGPDLTRWDCERGCSAYRRMIITLPAGWAVTDGLLHKHLGEPNEMTLSIWTVGSVYDDPCRWRDSSLSELDLAGHDHAADGAVVLERRTQGGLLNQAGRNASEPVEVEFGGPQFRQPTIRVEVSVPSELDIATCDQGQYRSWTEWDVAGRANSHHAAGQIDAIHMVDVDRRPLVIDASHMPATSRADLAEMEEILAALRIE